MTGSNGRLHQEDLQDRLFLGDATEVLKVVPDCSVDVIVTSPPYADNRKKTYQGFPIRKYVPLFLPITAELTCVLEAEAPSF